MTSIVFGCCTISTYARQTDINGTVHQQWQIRKDGRTAIFNAPRNLDAHQLHILAICAFYDDWFADRFREHGEKAGTMRE